MDTLERLPKVSLTASPAAGKMQYPVQVHNHNAHNQSSTASESCVPFMPNVMRVFLENGQTRSFKYDHSTTVLDVLESLAEKLVLKCVDHFSLMLEHPQGPRSNKLSLLSKHERLARIAARPGSQHFRCLLRLSFVPNDPVELYKTDPVAFEYYYQQCINDVVVGRYAYEMRYEACIRLASFHMQQLALDTKMISPGGKVSLKAIEKEYGLGMFLPAILLENVKRKEIRKHLRFYLKRDTSTKSASQSPNKKASVISNSMGNSSNVSIACSLSSTVLAHDPTLCLRIKYINTLCTMPSFGGRTFCVTFKDTETDMLMSVHPRQGLVLRGASRSTEPATSIHYDLLQKLCVVADTAVLRILVIELKNSDGQTLEFIIDKDDVDDLLLYTQGYHKLQTNHDLQCQSDNDPSEYANVPPYHGLHSVRPAGWNYERSKTSTGTTTQSDQSSDQQQRLVDLSRSPPPPPSPKTNQEDRQSTSREEESEDTEEKANDTLRDVSDDVISESECPEIGQPQKFLRAKDSMLTSDKPVVEKKKFIRAKDSILLHQKHGECKPKVCRHQSPSKTLLTPTRSAGHGDSSSETESGVDTPNQSPVKRAGDGACRKVSRPSQLSSTPEHTYNYGANSSFGLQSPDNLPCSQLSHSDLQQIVTTCGIENDTLEELLLLFPDNFCPDAEIIDLTLIGSPDQPGTSGSVALAQQAGINPPTPFRDNLDPSQEFAAVMERLAVGDVTVIEDSHQQAVFREQATVQEPQASSSSYPSIEQDPEAFEEFVRRSTVPPPPMSSPPGVDIGNDVDTSGRAKAVRFHPELMNTSPVLPMVAEPMYRSRPTIPSGHIPCPSQANLARLPPTVPPKPNTIMDQQDGNGDKTPTPVVRKFQLDSFTGLQGTEFEPPPVQKINLKCYSGLELTEKQMVPAGVNMDDDDTLETTHEMEYRPGAPQSPSQKERRRIFTNVRSNPDHFMSPGKSPRRHHGHTPQHSQRNSLVPPPLKSIAESPSSPADISTASSLCSTQASSTTGNPDATLMPVDSTTGNGCVQSCHDKLDYVRAQALVDVLITQIHDVMENTPGRSPIHRPPSSLDAESLLSAKTKLLSDAQKFAAATKMLVRSATDGASGAIGPPVDGCLNVASNKAQSMCTSGQALIQHADNLFKAQTVASKITECLHAFHATIACVQAAHGRSLAAPEMKKLMRQSTTLAATLTQLIQAVRNV